MGSKRHDATDEQLTPLLEELRSIGDDVPYYCCGVLLTNYCYNPTSEYSWTPKEVHDWLLERARSQLASTMYLDESSTPPELRLRLMRQGFTLHSTNQNWQLNVQYYMIGDSKTARCLQFLRDTSQVRKACSS